MKPKTVAKITCLFLGVVVSIFTISLAVFSWTPPTQTPPGCPLGSPGCDRPIHEGMLSQRKAGALGVGGVFRAETRLIVDQDVGIGTTSPGARLEVAGGIRINTTETRPACDVSRRGTIWFTQSAIGVRDTLKVCSKNANDAYEWINPWVDAPLAPTISCSVVSPSIIDVSWTDVENEIDYRIFRCIGTTCTPIEPHIHTTVANTTSWRNTGLDIVTTYRYRVIASNVGGDSPFSNIASCTTPVQQRRVFISSTAEDGSITNGVAGADATCQALANAAGLGGTWLAWLATNSSNAPAVRFTRWMAPYVLVDNTTKIADNWADLTDGTIDHLINKNQLGAVVTNYRVWTAVRVDGTANVENCGGWTLGSSTFRGGTGTRGEPHDDGLGMIWTDSLNERCHNLFRFYCFEQ